MEKRLIKNGLIAMMITVTVMLTSVGTFAQGSKTNFTGSWAFDADKSQAVQPAAQTQPQGQGQGQRGGGMAADFVAKQDANLLTVERTRTNREGEVTTTVTKYTLDGKESVNSTARGDSKSVATWSSDGKTLTIKTSRTMDMNGESVTMNSTEVWTLTDSKTLAITTTMATPNGERKSTAVYNKK
jgi:hypothetical protein